MYTKWKSICGLDETYDIYITVNDTLCNSRYIQSTTQNIDTVVPATAGPLGERPPALAGHFCDVPTTLPC